MRCSGGVGHRSKVSGGAGVEADRGLGCALEVEVAVCSEVVIDLNLEVHETSKLYVLPP